MDARDYMAYRFNLLLFLDHLASGTLGTQVHVFSEEAIE